LSAGNWAGLFDNSLDRLMLEAGRWSLEAGSYFAKRTQFQLAENRKIAPKSPKSQNPGYENIANEPNFPNPQSRPICPPKTCIRDRNYIFFQIIRWSFTDSSSTLLIRQPSWLSLR